MKIKYLGTAAAEGWPGIFCTCGKCEEARKLKGKNIRTRSQAIIDNRLLIDFPPDTYIHSLQHNVYLPDISHIIITHSHQDHLYPDEFLFLAKGFCVNKNLVNLYGNEKVTHKLRSSISKIPLDERERIIRLKTLKPYISYNVMEYTITPLLANHDKGEECFIYIIEKGNKRLLYGNDSGIFTDETWNYISGMQFDIISLDCTMGKIKEGTNHMGIPDNLETIERMKKVGCINEDTQIVLTHFSHNGGLLHHEVEDMVKQHGIKVAYDGFEIFT